MIMNPPQERNLAEAEEIVKSSWQDGKDILKANARLITAFAQALTQNTQEAKKEAYNIPMGVSQWRKYGERFGYWDYFKEAIKSKYLSEDEIKNQKEESV